MTGTELNGVFQKRFGHQGTLYFSPGRINLIGEHTDYNDGFVFPGAVDKGITAVIAANGLDICRVFAADIEDGSNCVEFGFDESCKPEWHWACYVFGVCREMIKRGAAIGGFDAVFSGDVPNGAGMSSSAALECVFAFALNEIFQIGFDRSELARIGQATEHNYCGVKCGIMDQFASLMGRKGSLIRLDCRSLEFEYFPFNPDGYRLMLVNTCVKHSLGNEYNERRESCEKAVAAIRESNPGVRSLRDADITMLEAVRDRISEDDFLRAKYVIDEKERVLAVCQALENGDYETVGRKMYETHYGLSREFTVSCPEADWLVSTARECGVTGSRIMGGGFGGCTINLVRNEVADDFTAKVTEGYEKLFGISPEFYEVSVGDGSRRL